MYSTVVTRPTLLLSWILLPKDTQNSARSSGEKKGWIRELRRWRTFSSNWTDPVNVSSKRVFVDSDCLFSGYHWPGNFVNTSFKQYVEKKWHDSNSTLEDGRHGWPVRTASRRKWMDVDRTTIQTNETSGSRHNYLLRHKNHSWKLSTSWWRSTCPRHLSSCQQHSETVPIHCHGWFFPFCAWDCTATSSFLDTCGLSYPLSSNSHKIQHGMPSSLSPQSPWVNFVWLQLLATNSHCKCELEHAMDMISSFAQSSLFSVLRQVNGICLLRQSDLPEVEVCMFAVCVRACMHYLHQSRGWSHPSLTVMTALSTVEFSDHLQILPWARLSQYSQK